jgi:hypothetical protein
MEVRVGGKNFIYIKDWFKPIFPFFLTWLSLKLNFLMPTVDLLPHPAMLLAKLRLCMQIRVTIFRCSGKDEHSGYIGQTSAMELD